MANSANALLAAIGLCFAGCVSSAGTGESGAADTGPLPPGDTGRPPRDSSGDGKPSTDGVADSADSDDLPHEAWVIWVSNREDSRHELYLRRAAGGPIERLTSNGAMRPRWSPDGRWISYYRPTDHQARVVRPDGSDDRQIFAGVPLFWLHDGSGVVCSTSDQYYGDADNSFYRVAPDGAEPELLFHKNDFKQLEGEANAGLLPGGITHDGRWLLGWVYGLFADGLEVENGIFKSGHSAVIFDLHDPTKLYYFGPGCTTATSPSGPMIYHVSRDSETMPDIFRMSIDDRDSRASYALELGHADEDWGHEYMPAIANDGRWMAYAASTGCHDHVVCDYEVFVHRLGATADQRQRITNNQANDAYPDLHVGALP